MNDERKCFTFIWKIKNFSFSFNYPLFFTSPDFFIQEMCGTKWNLKLYTKSSLIKDSIVCRLYRHHSDWSSDKLVIDYEMSFIIDNGSVLYSKLFLAKEFNENSTDRTVALSAKNDEVFVHKKHLFTPNDTLTIRCKMWKSQESITNSALCTVETQINTESLVLIAEIEEFSRLKSGIKYRVCIKSSSKHIVSSMVICVVDDDKLDAEIKLIIQEPKLYKFKIFIMDLFENKVKVGERDIYDTQLFCITFPFSKKYLLKSRELFLSHDRLTLMCEIISIRNNKLLINDLLYEYDYENIQTAIINPTYTNMYSEEHRTDSVNTLKEDLISLLGEGILCDTKLKTATEIFPAHMAILTARSPVFKSMFTTDMREKANNCVNIEDLDADTVRQMLLFIYSDTLSNLEYEGAKNLYFAADKYDIVALKQKCSNFLKKSLVPSNCSDVLLLADKHQDKDLKKYAQGCIVENDEAVFSTDEWKYLEENHPRLTTETLRIVCSHLKNRKI